jgi:hypothetical protein
VVRWERRAAELASSTAASKHEKEIPGKCPELCAVLLGLCNLTGAERKCPSYLLCSVVSDRRLEHALSDAYDQATAWRWVAERLANKLELPQERLDHAVLEVQQLQTVPAPTNVRANGSARHWSRGPLWGWRSTDPIINITTTTRRTDR